MPIGFQRSYETLNAARGRLSVNRLPARRETHLSIEFAHPHPAQAIHLYPVSVMVCIPAHLFLLLGSWVPIGQPARDVSTKGASSYHTYYFLGVGLH